MTDVHPCHLLPFFHMAVSSVQPSGCPSLFQNLPFDHCGGTLGNLTKVNTQEEPSSSPAILAHVTVTISHLQYTLEASPNDR